MKNEFFTHSFRIIDDEYKTLTDKVRLGMCTPEIIKELNNFDKEEDMTAIKDDMGSIYIAGKRNTVRALNHKCINKFFKNADKKSYATTDGEWEFSIGMKAIITMNDIKHRFNNGTRGKIEAMYDNSVIIRIFDNENNEKGTVRVGLINGMLPVEPAYASTVHKAQGQTYKSIMVIPEVFEGGQLYTVLSRVHTRKGIHLLKPIKDSDIRINVGALKYQYRVS